MLFVLSEAQSSEQNLVEGKCKSREMTEMPREVFARGNPSSRIQSLPELGAT